MSETLTEAIEAQPAAPAKYSRLAERALELEAMVNQLTTLIRHHPGQSLADAVTERVEDAFREGLDKGLNVADDDWHFNEDNAWTNSDARRSLNPPPKVELRAPALGDVDGQFE